MMNTNTNSRSRFSTKSAWMVALAAMLVTAAGYAAATGLFSSKGTITDVSDVNGEQQITVEMEDGSKVMFAPTGGTTDAKAGQQIELVKVEGDNDD